MFLPVGDISSIAKQVPRTLEEPTRNIALRYEKYYFRSILELESMFKMVIVVCKTHMSVGGFKQGVY